MVEAERAGSGKVRWPHRVFVGKTFKVTAAIG
jgi:hypothetical protein